MTRRDPSRCQRRPCTSPRDCRRAALTGGYRLSFGVAAGLLVAGFLLAATVLRSPKAPAHPEPTDTGKSSEADGSPLMSVSELPSGRLGAW
jgi:hypothetical protein